MNQEVILTELDFVFVFFPSENRIAKSYKVSLKSQLFCDAVLAFHMATARVGQCFHSAVQGQLIGTVLKESPRAQQCNYIWPRSPMLFFFKKKKKQPKNTDLALVV